MAARARVKMVNLNSHLVEAEGERDLMSGDLSPFEGPVKLGGRVPSPLSPTAPGLRHFCHRGH